jgi:hypothetical protein
MSFSLRRCRVLATIGLLVTVCGCVNLDDVAGFSKLAEHMRSTLPPVTADIPATCERQNTLIDDIPDTEKADIRKDDCAALTALAAHITADQAVLIDYLEALAKLASNKPLSYSKTIDTNVLSIARYTGLSTQAATASTAAQNITKALADFATHAYRARQVNKLILSTDPAIQQLTAALKHVITVEYTQILDNEALGIDTFYQGPIFARKDKAERLTLILVQRQYETDKLALAKRQAAAKAYGKIMDDLASTHAKLAAAAAKPAGFKQLAKDLGPVIASLTNSISDLAAQEK